MFFCVKTPINKLYVFGMALLLAVTLAGCGGGGSTATTPTDPPVTPPTPQEECESAGGRWNADMTCTSAADLEAERMAMVAAATKAAGTKAMAIAAEAGETGTNDGGLGGSTFDADGNVNGVVGTYSMAISHDGTSAKVTITDTANPAGADPPKPQFTQAMDLGGGTTMHVRAMAPDDDGNVEEEVVVVTTDIDPPVPTPFAKVDGQALNASRMLGGAATDDNPADSLDLSVNALDATTSADKVILDRVMSPAFVGSGSSTNLSFDGAAETTYDPDEAYTTPGTFNGAMGRYTCVGVSGSACTVAIGEMGNITAMSDNWIFTPDPGAMSDVPSSDFLNYGFWLKKTTAADGVVTYNEVETFAGSSVAASGATTSVLGQATYTGGATGVYVKNVYNPDRTLDMATSGHFTADVSLLATFGQAPVSDTDSTGTIAPNLLNTISGTIDNFTLSGGEANMWSVAVQGPIDSGAGTASGTAKGGDGDGSFSATFHGSVAAVDGVVPQPGSVVGEFNAGFTDGFVAGAFGARKMME